MRTRMSLKSHDLGQKGACGPESSMSALDAQATIKRGTAGLRVGSEPELARHRARHGQSMGYRRTVC